MSGERLVHCFPPGADTSSFDKVWANPRARKAATLLALKCPKGHFLAGVYRVGEDSVYAATLPTSFGGAVQATDGAGRPVGDPIRSTWHDSVPPAVRSGEATRWAEAPPSASGSRVGERYVELLGAMEEVMREHDPGSVGGPGDTVPASCACGHRDIPRSRLHEAIDAGGGWVTVEVA